MTDEVRTAFHKAAEAVFRGSMSFTQRRSRPEEELKSVTLAQLNKNSVKEFVTLLRDIPKFSFDTKAIDMLKSPDAISSIEAMHKAGVTKLPYPSCLIEWRDEHPLKSGAICTHMVMLQERDPVKMPQRVGEDVFHPYVAVIMRLITNTQYGEDITMFSPASMLVGFTETAGKEQSFGIHYASFEAPYVVDGKSSIIKQMTQEDLGFDVSSVDTALSAAVLLLNTRGISKTTITPTRLNKKRQGSGKEPIPTHTFIRLGHVYDRSGLAHNLDPNCRKPQRVHWRKAHTKMIVHGPGRTLRKMGFIEATLVNYQEGGDVPVPTAKVRW